VTGTLVLLSKELREQWRTMRMLVVGAVFLAFGILSPLTARYMPELIRSLGGSQFAGVVIAPPSLADAVAQFVKNVGSTAGLAAVLLAMGSVASEKERGTAAFVLSRPAGRDAFILAKLIAVGTTLLVSMALAGLAAYIYTTMLFEAPSAMGWLVMCALLWLTQLALAAVTILASTLSTSVALAGGIGFLAYVVLSAFGALPVLAAWTPQGLIGPATSAALGQPVVDAVSPLVGTLLLIVVPTIAACAILRRQEL
jgi:ABC-2 type transport system permease protein